MLIWKRVAEVIQKSIASMSKRDNQIIYYTKLLVSELTTDNFSINEVPIWIVTVAVSCGTDSSPDSVDANFNSAFIVH